MDYIGNKCPVCKKYFHVDDDIVVCPDCGTPHHRECYDFLGECANSDLHKDGYDYMNDPEHSDNGKPQARFCPRCGKENDTDAFFCKYCGTDMSKGRVGEDANTSTAAGNTNQTVGAGGMPFDFAYMDPLGGVQSDLDLGDSVTAGEASKYVKQNTPYFVRIFANIKTFNKSKFNFSAALFSGGYLLYRKMYKLGAFITSIEMLMLMLYSVLLITYNSSYQQILEISQNYAYGSEEYMSQMMKLFSSYSTVDILLLFLPALFYFSIIAIKIVMGITFNRMYFKHCKTQINRIKQNATDQESPDTLLQTKGGVNVPLAISLLITSYLIYYLPSFIMSMF